MPLLRIAALAAPLALVGALAMLPSQRTEATPSGSSCALTDITLTIMGGSALAPTACVTNTPQGSGPAVELTDMVSQFQSQDSLNLSALNNLLASSDGTSNTLQGIKFAASAAGTTSGTWTLSWTDVNGSSPLNLPVTVDLLVGIYGGNDGDGYEFKGVTLPAPPNNSGTGTFTITFLNNGGPDSDHLTSDRGWRKLHSDQWQRR